MPCRCQHQQEPAPIDEGTLALKHLPLPELEKLAFCPRVVRDVAYAGLDDDRAVVEPNEDAAVLDHMVIAKYAKLGLLVQRFLEIAIGHEPIVDRQRKAAPFDNGIVSIIWAFITSCRGHRPDLVTVSILLSVINYIFVRPPGCNVAPEVMNEQVGNTFAVLVCLTGGMRGKNNIIESP